MGVYEERAPPTTGMHWQPPNSQERGSGLGLGCQSGPGGTTGGPASVDQARDLSPCLPASMGDAARPTTLPCSPPSVGHQHGSSHQTTSLHQTHCGPNNNCYDGTSYDTSREYGSSPRGERTQQPSPEAFSINAYPSSTGTGGGGGGGGGQEYHRSGYNDNQSNISMPPTQAVHHHHNHHHHHHHHNQHQLQQSHEHHSSHGHQTPEHLRTVPKLEPPPTPPSPTPSGVVCAGCGLRISDRFYLQAVDRRWHAACLQCSHCRQGLDGEVTCFSKDGNIYCKKDYYRMFGGMKRCARCQAAILASELVMRARDLVFHVRCFCCAACAIPLTKGDHFGMRDGVVLCRHHYEMGAELHPAQSPPVPAYPPGPHYPGQPFPSPEFLNHHSHGPHPGHPHHSMHPQHPHQHPHASPVPLQPQTPSGPDGGSPPKVPYFNGAAAGAPPPRQKGRPRKRKPKDLEAMTASLDLNADYLDMPFGRGGPGTPGMPGSNSRTKRMRTSFKHHQLRTMKSYFAINHNPDAKDLKQLSQKTGLPKRVLQVWFQNARAKWRRMVLKQEGKSDKCGGGVDAGSLGDLELYGSSGGSGGPPMSPPFMLGGPHSPASLASLDCA